MRTLPWWAPWVAAFLPAVLARGLVGFGFFNFEQLIAAVLALGALVLLARRPAPSIAALVVLLPFQLVLTSVLYELGLSAGLTRMAALWKELVVLAVVVAAWWRTREQPGRLDPLDRVATAFVVLGTLYFVLPELFVGRPGSLLDVDTRFLAWRLVVLPAVLLLACRRLRLGEAELRTVARGVTGLGLGLGAVALVEILLSDWWNRFMVDVIGVNRFRVFALELNLRSLGLSFFDVRVYGEVAGRQIIRVGGPMLSHLTFSFVLVIALGLLVERLVRGDARATTVLALGACGVGLLFTQTRASIVGAAIMLVVALRPAPGRPSVHRTRYALLVGAVAAVAIPLAIGGGLADRFTEGDEFSDRVHELRVDAALETIADHPLGLGLGMGSTAGGRLAEGAVSVENQLLDTAVQLGVLGALLLAAQYLMLIVVLKRAADRAEGPAQAGAYAVRTAMIGLLVSLWYQQAFGLIEVSWVLFALAGVSLGAAEASADGRERRERDQVLAADDVDGPLALAP